VAGGAEGGEVVKVVGATLAEGDDVVHFEYDSVDSRQ